MTQRLVMLMQDGGLVSGAGANDWIGTSSPPPQAARSKAVVAAHHKLIKGSKLRRQPQKARMLRQLSLTNSMESSPSITITLMKKRTMFSEVAIALSWQHHKTNRNKAVNSGAQTKKRNGHLKTAGCWAGRLGGTSCERLYGCAEQTCQISFALSQW